MFELPNVIASSKTLPMGSGARRTRETLPVEMQTQSLADVRAMIKNIIREVTTQQTALGNPPSTLEVDGGTNKDLEAVDKRATVIYGVTLATAAMREIEIELAAAIARSTTAHSGRLGNIQASWQWLYIPKGGAPRRISSGAPILAFSAGDALVLEPTLVPYATLTNRNVAHGGRLNVKPRKGKASSARSAQNLGFFATVARRIRRRQAFKPFTVTVVFSKTHMVPGEVMTRTQGTGMLVLRPRVHVVRV